ncbi:MAG: hypothetical protein EOP35_23660 [Rubrivivax sp.]|nr:MAG: hypothetical protein EOP35_23660 [Rubrivivax sp.]
MRKFTRTVHDRLPAWAQDWLDLIGPLFEVALIALSAWLLMRLAHLLWRRLASNYALPLNVGKLFLRVAAVLVYGGATADGPAASAARRKAR